MFDPNILMKITLTCQNRFFSLFIKTWTIRRHCSFLVVNLNGTKTLMGFIGQHAHFCCTQKLKLPSLVINRPVKLVCVQNASSSDVLGRPTWSPGHPRWNVWKACRAPQNFYSGDQLWGLGALTKMLGSLKLLLPLKWLRGFSKVIRTLFLGHFWYLKVFRNGWKCSEDAGMFREILVMIRWNSENIMHLPQKKLASTCTNYCF